jgi:D-threo-aldose 1-dehydrogenase
MATVFSYSVSEEQACETLRTVFRSPINFLDTAAIYGDGESERRIGIVLKELGGVPQGYVLATKVDRDAQTNDFSGDQMKRSIERSMRLLGVDHFQLVYLHDPEHISFEQAMAPGGPVEALQQMREVGLIEHIGVAGGPLDLMTRFVETDIFEVALSHNYYTLLNASAHEFWNVCQQHHVAAVNAAPYGGGMLSKGPRAFPRYRYADAPQAYIERALQIDALCTRYGVPLAAAALQFSVRDPRIASTVVGLTRPERMEQTIKLALQPIPQELWEEIEQLNA